MHYRNGREAKNGDKVVSLAGYGTGPVNINAIGILFDAVTPARSAGVHLTELPVSVSSKATREEKQRRAKTGSHFGFAINRLRDQPDVWPLPQEGSELPPSADVPTNAGPQAPRLTTPPNQIGGGGEKCRR